MTAYAGFDTEPYPRRLPAKSFNVVGLCSQQVLDAFSSFCGFFVLSVLLFKMPSNILDLPSTLISALSRHRCNASIVYIFYSSSFICRVGYFLSIAYPNTSASFASPSTIRSPFSSDAYSTFPRYLGSLGAVPTSSCIILFIGA